MKMTALVEIKVKVCFYLYFLTFLNTMNKYLETNSFQGKFK